MKSASATLIAILFPLGAALIIASVNAQSPSATPTTSASVGSIPEKIPPNFTANGWDQAGWTAMREHCRAVFSQLAAAQKMTPEQIKTLAPIPRSDWELCSGLSQAFSAQSQTTQAEGGMPEKAPPGWDQAAWTAIRENCERNLLEMARRAQLTAAQRSLLPSLNFSHGDMMLCAHLSLRPQTSLQPSTAGPRGVAPTPLPTP